MLSAAVGADKALRHHVVRFHLKPGVGALFGENIGNGVYGLVRADGLLAVGAVKYRYRQAPLTLTGDAPVRALSYHGHYTVIAPLGIPFYIAAPTNTIDFLTANGKNINIEERSGAEIKSLWYKSPMVPPQAQTFNPAFDVTPAKYITAIITEAGVFQPYNLEEIQNSQK